MPCFLEYMLPVCKGEEEEVSLSVPGSFSSQKGQTPAVICFIFHTFLVLQDDMRRWEKLGRANLEHNYITDAVVGSLPHGLSLDDRRSLFESMPASPMVKNLQSVSEVHTPAYSPVGDSIKKQGNCWGRKHFQVQ